MTDTNLLTAALEYAAKGLPVFPCKRTDKSPLTKHGYKDATTDPDQIRGWWEKWPAAMIGMPTGVIDVVDLDVKKGKNGFAAVPDWADRSPIIVRTPSDPELHTEGAPLEGAHLWFKSEGTVKLGTDVIALGVDIRCKGGYVIVPPSMNGFGAYRFEKGGLDQIANLPTFPADLAARDKDDEDDGPHTSATEFKADLFRINAAVEVIPNDDLSREEWNNIGMAIWSASGGDKAGLDIFYRFSKKSNKHHNQKTVTDRWKHYFRSPPDRIGFGSLWYLATKADPSWEDRALDQIERRLFHSHDPNWGRKFVECIEKQADVSVLVEDKATPAVSAEAKPESKHTTSTEPDPGALIISSRKLVANFKPPIT